MDLMDKGIKILQLENIELCNSTADRRAKKKKKQVILFTELVFTTKQAKVLLDAREAAKEAKQGAKNTKKRLKKERKEMAIIAQAQV